MNFDEVFRQLERFIRECSILARTRGTHDHAMGAQAAIRWGFEPHGSLTYRDAVVEIIAEAEPSQSVLVIRRLNRNPVFCTDKNGRPRWWHGEIAIISAYVHSILTEQA